MSDSRRLNNADAQSNVYHAGDAQRSVNTANSRSVLTQEQYEEARRRAQAAATEATRARRRVQQSDVDAYRAVQARAQARAQAQAQAQAQARAQAQAQMNAQPYAPAQRQATPTQAAPANGEATLTMAQRQAIALRRRAEQARVPEPTTNRRTINRATAAANATGAAPGPNVRQLDLKNTHARRAAYDFDNDGFEEAPGAPGTVGAARVAARPAAAAPRTINRTATPAQTAAPAQMVAPAVHRASGASRAPAQPERQMHRAGGHSGASASGGGKPPKPPKNSKPIKGEKGGSGPNSGKGKQKKKGKGTWWKAVLGTLLAICIIFGGTFALIMHAIAPEAGAISISDLINTPKEFQDKELNILITGVDRSSTDDLNAGAANDSNVNDGMTDMIMYLHFNNETGEVKMLQIPRDTMVTEDTSISANYRINGVAKTQGSDNNNNMAALCELVADQYKLPIDGYVTIRLEMLTALVDLFGGIELNVPIEMDYDGSHLDAGYQTLNGTACEFLLRTRKIYPDGDLGRLNMQRQFYSALFRKLKSIGNIWDVAKLTPAVLNYMQTDLNASQLVSFAVSMLKVDSNKIMICRMPVISGPMYGDQALIYPARNEDAELLNTYFRENTGAVEASALNVCDNAVDLSGYTATDADIQYMGGIMAADAEAQQNNNLDGSHIVEGAFVEESADSAPAEEAAPAA